MYVTYNPAVIYHPILSLYYYKYVYTQISCVSSSPALENRSRFKRYFQLLSSEATLALAYYAIIKEYEWRRVSFIVQDESVFTVVSFHRVVHTLTDEQVTSD